jgi:hypothetical protein
VVIQLFHYRRLQIVDAAKDATANARLGDVSKNRSTRLTQEAAMDEKWSIVVYLSRFDQAAIFSMLSCTPSLNTTPSMT